MSNSPQLAHVGHDVAGQDALHRDALATVFVGQAFGEPEKQKWSSQAKPRKKKIGRTISAEPTI